MIDGVKSVRFLVLVFLVVTLPLTEAVNETDAVVQNEHDADLDFANNRTQTNTTVDGQPAATVPVSDDIPFCGLAWVFSGNGNVPQGAVVGGHTANGERLYIGRAYFKDDLLPGKIHPSNRCLYVSYGGEEHKISNYEVLVQVRHRFEGFAEEELHCIRKCLNN